MLTATYALLTLSMEQKKERGFIARIQQYLQAHAARPGAANAAFLTASLEELTRFAEARHQRKLEACLMPALRQATHDAGPLLADLESLSKLGGKMRRALGKCLQRAFRHDVAQVKLLYRTLDLYCQNLLARLAKEEHELLPLARRVISSEGWFAIGSSFLAHDDARGKARRPL